MGRYHLSISPPAAACQRGVVRRACDEGVSGFNIEYVHSSGNTRFFIRLCNIEWKHKIFY
jgi:hypothetical protein